MAALNLAAFKPSAGQGVASGPIANAMTAIEAAVNAIDNTQFAAGRIFDPLKLIEANSVQAIADSLAGGAVANFDFTSIPSTFRHLLVVESLRGDTAAAAITPSLRLNNDSTANYDHQALAGSAAVATASEGIGATSLSLPDCPAASATAAFFGGAAFFIPQYAGATANKVMFALGLQKTGNGSGNLGIWIRGGGWRTTATAINRLTIIPSSGNFVAGSRVTLYGLG